ncbi:hypothetical protein [Pseudoalteromonas luteoviolacea]|uniref:Type II secretion system protein GspG C-terminal domain-containing protein n=1 Tax=Pseudoalteromonas luteoviolacea H33 TaxID=1365251 RepID=A0A167AGT8_9GAMM|nr:hypothetical protein [Pseudoalteromonas luteoviolacea]KZN45370.1 hypothetical protein N476_04970 [Pseudoalteromonas luteoviolacea H33]KZN70766.1 hypothetical protein N477_05070 [Pseudoalteromonas luteoviolacea H33-S]
MKRYPAYVALILTIICIAPVFMPTTLCGPPPQLKIQSDVAVIGKMLALNEKTLELNLSRADDVTQYKNTLTKTLNDSLLDPWGKPYGFEYLGSEPKTFIIWSMGSIDSEEGLVMYLFKEEGSTYKVSLLTRQSDE